MFWVLPEGLEDRRSPSFDYFTPSREFHGEQNRSSYIAKVGFGHFYVYAPEKIQYVIDRYSMEVKRQLDVLDRELSKKEFIIGDDYTIADISIWPWYGRLVLGQQYGAADFLQVSDYHNVLRWAKNLSSRPAVMRGERINRKSKIPNQYLLERHSSFDFEALDFET